MRRTPRHRLAALVLATGLALAGCWDRHEIDETSFVLASGIDAGPAGTFVVTQMVAVTKNLPSGGQAGGGGAGETFMTYSLRTLAPVTTLNAANAFVSRRLTLQHDKVFIFGEQMAREGRIYPFIAAAARFREMRPTFYVAVAKGTAADLLSLMRSRLAVSPAKYLETVIPQGIQSGILLPSTASRFLQDSVSDARTPVALLASTNLAARLPVSELPPEAEHLYPFPMPDMHYQAGKLARRGETPVEWLGTALFRGGKLVETLSGAETQVLAMLSGTLEQTYVSVSDPHDPKLRVPISLKLARTPRINARLVQGRWQLEADLRLEGDLLGLSGSTDYTDPLIQPELEQAVTQVIRKAVEQVLAKMQKVEADPVGFGQRARTHYLTWQEWQKVDWPKAYTGARPVLKVSYRLRRFGLSKAPLTIPRTGGAK